MGYSQQAPARPVQIPRERRKEEKVPEKTRSEHLEWCKQRALEYAENGDISSAIASMGSDLGKHPETKDHPAIKLGTMMLLTGSIRTPEQAARFINGFN